MKKLFSFISVFALAAILGVSSVSAQKTVATVEKLWSKTVAEVGATIADTRQGTGVDGKVYLLNKANQSLVAISAEGQDTVCVGPLTVAEGVTANLDATAYALDDAANFVMVGTFPNVPSHIVLRKADGSVVKDLAITGLARTDFINAVGDVFSAEGGYVFVYGNSANLLVYTIANGELVGEPANIAGSNTSNNYVVAGNATKQIVHHRTSEAGWKVLENGAETLIEGMEGFKNTTMGGDIITLAGKEFYIYPAGSTNYNSEFVVRNMTDAVNVTDKDGASIFYANTTTTASSTITACWLNASKIDDNSAYIHVYNADGVAVFKLSVVVAATVTLNVNDAAMGTVEGAGDYAVGGNATVKAIPALGHSFVAWKNGEETVSTDAEYTFAVTGDVALTAVFQAEANKTLTLAVNDAAMGSITLPEGIVMGANTVAYGTPVALTAVPAEGATFNGWYAGEALYSSEYTINLTVTADLALTAQFAKSLMLEYDLGGGVTNNYGWLSKAHMCLDLQNDYNVAYSTSKEWAKMENGVIFYNVNNKWLLPEEAVGSAADAAGFLQALTYNTSDNLVKLLQTEKWLPLGEYINGLRTAAGNPVADEGAMRADLSGFFLNSPAITDYRKTNDYTIAGQPASFCPAMKMGFDNPTEVTREVVLNDPYHATLTFYGWYAAADFSGEKYTKVSPETVVPGGKLYAKFDEYIPTIAEVMAMEEGVETKISGVVNWVRNNNVFIQDNTGGFLLYGSDLAPEVGTKIIAKGKRGSHYGSPQLSGTVIEATEAATLYAPANLTLADLFADSTALKYFGQRVQVLGVKVAEYDSYGNVYLTDGTHKIKGHYMVPDQAVFTVGKKVDIVAVASQYQGTVQFEGDVAGLTVTVIGLKDPYAYPTRGENNQYKLENRWVISNVMENFAANAPGGDQKVRGMAAKDGIMYFINQAGYIVRVDGKTGSMLDPITITGDHLFEQENVDETTGESSWSSAVTYGFNDIKFDSEGNCLITGLPTSSAQRFMVYEVDLETGAATEVINERLADNPDFEGVTARFDAMGVNGDIHGNACVMAACAGGGLDVFRWLIIDGEAQPAALISMLLDPEVDTYMWNITGWGTAPQIFPQDEVGSLFYVDGNTATPMLFDEGGMLVDDFANCPSGTNVWNNPGDTTQLKADLCGLQEFQVGDEYFMVMIGTHTPSTPPQAFALYKFADAGRTFEGMEPLWYFPKDGLGGASNGVRTAVPTVEVEGNKATIYLYAQNNGYAVYEFTVGDVADAVEDVEATEIGARKVIENGQVYVIKNGVKYNVLGAEVK